MKPKTRSMTITIKSSPDLRLEFRKGPGPDGGVELVVTVSTRPAPRRKKRSRAS